MSTLIALNGRKGAGKDTAFGFIQEWAAERGVSCSRRGFADALKLSFARLFIPDCSVDESVQWCDELKHGSLLNIQWSRGPLEGTRTTINHEITGRTALQRFGTEGHREVFGDNFWVDVLLPLNTIQFAGYGVYPPKPPDAEIVMQWPRNFMHQFDQEAPELCVITDCRFENEAQRVKDLHGVVWEIDRLGLPLDTHASEVPLPGELIDRTFLNREGEQFKLRGDLWQAMDDLIGNAA